MAGDQFPLPPSMGSFAIDHPSEGHLVLRWKTSTHSTYVSMLWAGSMLFPLVWCFVCGVAICRDYAYPTDVLFACSTLEDTLRLVRNRQWKFSKHSVKIQGTFSEHAVHIQGTFGEYSVNIQWTFSEHSANIQRTFSEHSVNIQRTFSEHSVNIQGTFREHSLNNQCRFRGTFSEHSVNTQLAAFRQPLRSTIRSTWNTNKTPLFIFTYFFVWMSTHVHEELRKVWHTIGKPMMRDRTTPPLMCTGWGEGTHFKFDITNEIARFKKIVDAPICFFLDNRL
jgi:hypothetical protein